MSQDEKFTAEVFRYLDGELSAEEALAFERRIDEDEELGREFRSIAEVDLLESLGSSDALAAPRGKFVRWLVWGVSLVAASTLVFVLLRNLGPAGLEPENARIALLPLVTSQEDYNALLGLEPGWLPEGNGTLGATDGVQERPSPEEYAARVSELERERRSTAFQTKDKRLVAGRYVVALHVEDDAYGLVIRVSEEGGADLAWPKGDEPVLLEGGRDHVFPRPSVELGEPGELGVAFDPGYLRPLGVGEEVLLIALRREAPGSLANLRAELSGLAGESLADRVAAARGTLERMGWSVAVRSVSE